MGLKMDLDSLLVRRHKCEKCNRIFQCLRCQKAMEKQTQDVALYSLRHTPFNLHVGEKYQWLCDNCI